MPHLPQLRGLYFVADTFDMLPLLGSVRGLSLTHLSLGYSSAADVFLEYVASRGFAMRALQDVSCIKKTETVQRLIAWSLEHREPFLPNARRVSISGTTSASAATLDGFGALFPELQAIRTRSKSVAVAAVLSCPKLVSVDETLGTAELHAITEGVSGRTLGLEMVVVRATEDTGLLSRFLSLCPRLRRLTVFAATGVCVHALQRCLHVHCQLSELRFFSSPPFHCTHECAMQMPPLPVARLELYAGVVSAVLPSVRLDTLRSVCIAGCPISRTRPEALERDLRALSRLERLSSLTVVAEGLTTELCTQLLPRIRGLAALSCELDEETVSDLRKDEAFGAFVSGLASFSARFSVKSCLSPRMRKLSEFCRESSLKMLEIQNDPRVFVVEKPSM
eukprot:m51a1_g11619 hypothetical protein (393) ;mRNA; f:28244-29585